MRLALPSLLAVSTLALAACKDKPQFEAVCQTTASDPTKSEVIAVIGDGYDKNDEGVFKANIRDLVCNALFNDPVYARHRHRFTVVAARHVSNVSKVTNNERDTAFKTVFNGSPAQCNFTESPHSVALIREAVHDVDGLRSVILLAHAGSGGGYANGDLIYIASGSTANIAPHEYGHRAGLHDENVVVEAPYEGTEDLSRTNCSTECDPLKVWWKSEAGQYPRTIGVFDGCLYHNGNICRPSLACRMRAPAEPFSHVCGGLVAEYLERGNISRPPAGDPLAVSSGPDDYIDGDYHQIVVSIESRNAKPVFSISEQTGGFRPQVRPMSETFYAVSDGANVLFAESVRTRSIRTQCYPGDDAKPPHEGEGGDNTFFVARVPKSVRGNINRETLQLLLYQASPGRHLAAVNKDTVQAAIRDGHAVPMSAPAPLPLAR